MTVWFPSQGEAMPRPYERQVALVARAGLILAVLALASGCSARVTGMMNPVPHDYAAVAWQPLVGEVRQPFLVGPGYSAAFGNDAQTTPEQLIARYQQLPGDAAAGELVELRVGARPMDDEQPLGGATVGLRYAPELDLRFPERVAADWPAEQLWLPELAGRLAVEQTFVSPYPMLDGVTVRTATLQGDLTPGEGVVGPAGARVFDSPYSLEPTAQLAAGAAVAVTGSTEGFAAVLLPAGRSGYVLLDAFASLPPPDREVAGPLQLELLDAHGAVVRTATAAQMLDNAHLELRFAALPDSQGATYTMRFTMPRAGAKQAAALRASAMDIYADGALRVDGAAQPGDLVFRPLYAADDLLFEAGLAELPRDGDWVIIENPPALAAGTVAELALRHVGEPAGWEYGRTPGRAPYGGWLAVEHAVQADDPGAVLFETVYARDVAAGALVRDGAGNLRAAVSADPGFALVYGGLLTGALVLTGLLVGRARQAGGLRNGR